MENCPFCASPIPADATSCPSCGRVLSFSSGAPELGQTPAQLLEAKISRMAVASLIFSFFSLLLIPGVLAIVFGHASRRKIKRSAGKLKGKGVAFAGLVFGYLGVFAFPLIAFLLMIPSDRDHIQRSNMASAVGNLRTLNTAAITYASTYEGGFPSSLAVLGLPQEGKPPDAERAYLIDDALASGRKSGYVFTYRVTATDDKGFPSAYTINADPADANSTGESHYFTDESGVFRSERDHPANKDSPALAG